MPFKGNTRNGNVISALYYAVVYMRMSLLHFHEFKNMYVSFSEKKTYIISEIAMNSNIF
jgi:hypothetical protein